MKAPGKFIARSASDGYKALVELVLINGHRCDDTLEVLGANVTILHEDKETMLIKNIGRDISTKYLAGEIAFFMSMSNDLKFISHYSKFWNKISDDGESVVSAYGSKALPQMAQCLKHLVANKNSRRATILIPTIKDFNNHQAKDVPCTISLTFVIRFNLLHCFVVMRSNDLWFGFPYDITIFSILHQIVLGLYNQLTSSQVKLGMISYSAHSCHIYLKNMKKLENVITKKELTNISLPLISYEEMLDNCRELLKFEEACRFDKPCDLPAKELQFSRRLSEWLL